MTVRQTLSSLRSVLRRIWGNSLGRIALILSLIAGGMYGCVVVSFPQESVRYRMTIDIEADGKVHTGSGVIEVTYRLDPNWLPQSRYVQAWSHGEAVAIDLGPRGVVFALLEGLVVRTGGYGPDPNNLVIQTFGPMDSLGGMTRAELRKIGRLSGSAELPLTGPHIPNLVSFADPTEPTSVRVVYATDHPRVHWKGSSKVLVDNFAALYGAGARLKRVHIEMTRDPVTRGIEKHLPWLAGPKSGPLDGHGTHRMSEDRWSLANSLSGYNFRR